MEAFQNIRSPAILLRRDNVDTDLIFPGEYLTVITRTNLGRYAFQTLRFDADGKVRPDSAFDTPPFDDAQILISGANFGCGSSREHAVWCLRDLGIRVIIAEDFADIFAANCLQNGLLTITLEKPAIERVREAAADGNLLSVDLDEQMITSAGGLTVAFEIDGPRKRALKEGLDEITLTLQYEAEIEAFEVRQSAALPWLYGMGNR